MFFDEDYFSKDLKIINIINTRLLPPIRPLKCLSKSIYFILHYFIYA